MPCTGIKNAVGEFQNLTPCTVHKAVHRQYKLFNCSNKRTQKDTRDNRARFFAGVQNEIKNIYIKSVSVLKNVACNEIPSLFCTL